MMMRGKPSKIVGPKRTLDKVADKVIGKVKYVSMLRLVTSMATRGTDAFENSLSPRAPML